VEKPKPSNNVENRKHKNRSATQAGARPGSLLFSGRVVGMRYFGIAYIQFAPVAALTLSLPSV
jgi:hypothetical protein